MCAHVLTTYERACGNKPVSIFLSVPENVQDFFWMAQVTVRSPMPTVSKKNVLQTRSHRGYTSYPH